MITTDYVRFILGLEITNIRQLIPIAYIFNK
jgi:hypothetical protein